MPELSAGVTVGIVVVASIWLVVAGATIWLFRASGERREQVRGKLLHYYFRGLPEPSDDPVEEMVRRRSFVTQAGAQLVGDLVTIAVILVVGWFVLGGADGDTAGLIVVFIVAPLAALHPYVIILTLILNRRSSDGRDGSGGKYV